MVLKSLIRGLSNALNRLQNWAAESKYEAGSNTKTEPDPNTGRKVLSLWDFVDFQVDTQADHLIKVVGFEEYVDMDEIRRRIREVLQIEYKNERSLYPYIKTLTDTGFFETSNVGGRRKWRKKELLFEILQESTNTEHKQSADQKTNKMMEIRLIAQRDHKIKKIIV